jgi:hypothetical protein
VLAAASPYLKQLLLTASPTGDLLDDQAGISFFILYQLFLSADISF